MKRVFAIRPEPGLSATLAAGKAAGLDIAGWPLSEIRPVAWESPPLEEIDGLLLGSANAVRHGGATLEGFRARPAYAVGDATADAARAAGFTVTRTGEGVLQPLVDELAGMTLQLLRPTGREHVPLDPPPGITVQTRVVYENACLPMPDALAHAMCEGGIVLLHSAVTARHFAQECARLSLPREAIGLAALGPRIAAAAGSGWAGLRVAETPADAALLALAKDMCH